MLICIENLIGDATLSKLRNWLSSATFEDGRVTAGGNARLVKNNEQVSEDPDRPDPRVEEMQDLVTDQLWNNSAFNLAAQPKDVMPPLFSRYVPGKAYGRHVDNAIINDARADLSLTLFLSNPDDYDGGQLVIEFSTGVRTIKAPAGSAVLYPTTALHQVTEVTRGTRLAAVTWIRSLVRESAQREILWDLKMAQQGLLQKLGKTDEIDLLSKAYTNLLRGWIED